MQRRERNVGPQIRQHLGIDPHRRAVLAAAVDDAVRDAREFATREAPGHALPDVLERCMIGTLAVER